MGIDFTDIYWHSNWQNFTQTMHTVRTCMLCYTQCITVANKCKMQHQNDKTFEFDPLSTSLLKKNLLRRINVMEGYKTYMSLIFSCRIRANIRFAKGLHFFTFIFKLFFTCLQVECSTYILQVCTKSTVQPSLM